MLQRFSPIASVVAHQMTVFTHLEEMMATWDGSSQVTPEVFGWIKERAEAAETIVSDLNLNVSRQKTRMLSHCIAEQVTQVEQLRNRLREVKETIIQELSNINFLRVTDDMETYLDKKSPFGQEVSTAFPGSVEDIVEAHNCFAWGTYTAAMFHLGRAMESGVKRLAKRMSIKIQRDDWQAYLSAMNDKISKMPFKTPKDKAKRAPFAEAAAYLLHFKEAWRNQTMHPKKTYTREQALEVINGAGTFLRYVSRVIFKSKPPA